MVLCVVGSPTFRDSKTQEYNRINWSVSTKEKNSCIGDGIQKHIESRSLKNLMLEMKRVEQSSQAAKFTDH
jgi:hypothetical protein